MTRVGRRGRGRVHLRHGGRQPAPGRARGRARRGAARRRSPPTGRPGCAAPAPTRPPTRSRIFGGCADFLDVRRAVPGAATVDAVARGRRSGPSGAVARPVGGGPAPVHLNVQLDEPLVPGPDRWDRRTPAARRRPGCAVPADPRRRRCSASGPRTVVVAGDDAGPPARVLAEDGRLAAARRADQRVAHRRQRPALLPPAARRRRSAGGSSGSWCSATRRCPAPVTPLLARDDVEVVAVPAPRPLGRRPFAVDRSVPAAWPRDGPDDPAWLERVAGRRHRGLPRRLDALLAAEAGLTPHEVAGAVSAAVPPGGLLFVGASSPIRDLDLMVAPYAVGDRRKVVANRGAGRHRRHRLERRSAPRSAARTAPATSR